MRRPALAQAPAFRAPGGAAAHPQSSKQQNRQPTAYSSRQPAPAPPGAARRAADSAHPAPGHGHEPTARTPATSSHITSSTSPRRGEQATELTKARGLHGCEPWSSGPRDEANTQHNPSTGEAQRRAVNLEDPATRATAPEARTDTARVAGNDCCSTQATQGRQPLSEAGDEPPSEQEPKAATAGLRGEGAKQQVRRVRGSGWKVGRSGPLARPVIPKGCQTPADRSRQKATLTRRPTPGSASTCLGRRGNRTSAREVSAAPGIVDTVAV